MEKTCLILGVGSDIGRAVAKTLSPDYKIIGTYFNTQTTLPKSHKTVQCDLREPSQISELFDGIEKLDLMVTAAFPFLENENFNFEGYLKAESFLRGHVYAITRAAEKMNAGGKIFNILGQCVERGLAGAAFYSASFAFLHNYSHSINSREGKDGTISVCDLLLGPVDTREWTELSKEVVQKYRARVANFISPQQIADTVKFLASQPILPSTFKLDAYCGY